MVDSRKEVPVADEHFKAHGFTVPEELLALVTSGELKDLSWHNDAAPSYGQVVDDEVTLSLWVDHVDRKAREFFEGKRFGVSVFGYDGKRLNISNADNIINTDDIAEAIKAWRETLAEVKRQLDALTAKTCEACNIALPPDLNCTKCGVSHAGDACPTCGRFGLHKDDCTQPPCGNGFEGGPAYKG